MDIGWVVVPLYFPSSSILLWMEMKRVRSSNKNLLVARLHSRSAVHCMLTKTVCQTTPPAFRFSTTQFPAIDLSGGFFDAGDHVKFGFPGAAAATMLAWGVIDFKQGYASAGLLPRGLELLKAFTDYFLKCWRDSPDGKELRVLQERCGWLKRVRRCVCACVQEKEREMKRTKERKRERVERGGGGSTPSVFPIEDATFTIQFHNVC